MLPKPAEGFEWVDVDSRPALVCSALASIAPHLFTTRAWPIGSPASGNGAWTSVSAAAGAPRLLRLTQVHAAGVIVHRRAEPLPDGLPAADIVLSDDVTVAVAVQAADCVPLLVADRRLGVVAAAHAGWRGLAAGVPGVTVHALANAFGSRPADLIVAIGPSIGACCYEVGGEVRETFARTFANASSGWFSDEPLVSPANPPFRELRQEPGQSYFDGWASARDQLASAGVPPDHIHVAKLCTASHAAAFPSYRRENGGAGRLAAVIRAERCINQLR